MLARQRIDVAVYHITSTELARALDAQGKRDTQVIVLAGDGGTYDIGFQCLSSAAERNEDFIYFCLDNEGYMNTGAQKSSSTPHLARTGSTPTGKASRKKNLPEILAVEGIDMIPSGPGDLAADLDNAARLLNRLGRAASCRGVTLCYEPDRGCPFWDRYSIESLMARPLRAEH
mgnify:CR=1 FL=1